MARIWSRTATEGRPSQLTGIWIGGRPVGVLESGITTTVRRCSFTMLVVSTRHGRVLRISAPRVGSSLTHQISPRRGGVPRFGGFTCDRVELFFNFANLRVVVRGAARFHQELVAFGKLLAQRAGQILGTLSSGDSPHELRGQVFRQGKCHLSGGHTPILPYFVVLRVLVIRRAEKPKTAIKIGGDFR